jgi:hypothetical protein
VSQLDPFRLAVDDVLYEYACDLMKTGLYGNTVSEALTRCIEIGIQCAISKGTIAPKEKVRA